MFIGQRWQYGLLAVIPYVTVISALDTYSCVAVANATATQQHRLYLA